MRNRFLTGLVFAVIAAYSCIHDSAVVRIIAVSIAAELAPQISNERGVKLTVTRPDIPSEAKTWDFQVVLETHTQDLSDDLAEFSVLIAEGRQYLPLGWEGAPPGGHHRKGRLRFKAIVPQPQSLELQIRLKNDPVPRSFKWLLQ